MPSLPQIPRKLIAAAFATWVACVVGAALLHDASGAAGALARTTLETVASIALATTGVSAIAEWWRRREWQRRTAKLARQLITTAGDETVRLAQLMYSIPLGVFEADERMIAVAVRPVFALPPGREAERALALLEATNAAVHAAVSDEKHGAHHAALGATAAHYDTLIAEAQGTPYAISQRGEIEVPVSESVLEAWASVVPKLEDQVGACIRAVADVTPYLSSESATLVLDSADSIQNRARTDIFDTTVSLPRATPIEELAERQAARAAGASVDVRTGFAELQAQIESMRTLAARLAQHNTLSYWRRVASELRFDATRVRHSLGSKVAEISNGIRPRSTRGIETETAVLGQTALAAAESARQAVATAAAADKVLLSVGAIVTYAFLLQQNLAQALARLDESQQRRASRMTLRAKARSAAERDRRTAQLIETASQLRTASEVTNLDRQIQDRRSGEGARPCSALGSRLLELQLAILKLVEDGVRFLHPWELALMGATRDEILATYRSEKGAPARGATTDSTSQPPD